MVWPAIDWGWAIRAFLAHFGLGVLVATFLYWLLDFLFIKRECRVEFKEAARVGFIGGLFSVAIDLDHVVMFFGAEYTRPLHWPLFIFSAIAALSGLLLCMIFRGGHGKVDNNSELSVVRKIFLVIVCSICWMVHVIEDFTVGLF